MSHTFGSSSKKGGPVEKDYAELDNRLAEIHSAWRRGEFSSAQLADFRSAFGNALSISTLQGFGLAKPYGYAGDFDIIDRIYRMQTSSEPGFSNWDRFFHQHAAARTTRNRKAYFHRLLDDCAARHSSFRVLKIASGPGRGMFEWLSANPTKFVSFDCVENDPRAIAYASQLNCDFLDRITFTQKNVLRFQSTCKYDLVWAAGIFDYFEDETFDFCLRKLRTNVADGSELVIGNYSERNPSRAYMEVVGDWYLNHRSEDRLISLARNSGVSAQRVVVRSEPEGVQNFLHIADAGTSI
jgi:extracellular factor (EF) 3-hydroxypalmitic acid methyl ester biosynthesis protein